MKRFGWFALAGSLGFLADAGMLSLLLAATPLGPLPARIIAIAFAMLVTWGFNRAVTFGRSRYPLLVEGARYGGVGILSALVNYAIYAAVILLLPAIQPVVAVVIASAMAMVFSWLGYSRFVFRT